MYYRTRKGVRLTVPEYLWLGIDRERAGEHDELATMMAAEPFVTAGQGPDAMLRELPLERLRGWRVLATQPDAVLESQVARSRNATRYTDPYGTSVPNVDPWTDRPLGAVRSQRPGPNGYVSSVTMPGARPTARRHRQDRPATTTERVRAHRRSRYDADHARGIVHTHHATGCPSADCERARNDTAEREARTRAKILAAVARPSDSWDRQD